MKPPKFVFKYRGYVTKNPESGIEETYYYPMLPCILEWAGRRSPQTEGLLDSGASGLVIPRGLAEFLGLELREEKEQMRVPGAQVPHLTARVNLNIGRGGRFFPFPNVKVHIPKEGDTPILIGRDPAFRAYKVTFDEKNLTFSLEPYK